MDKAPSPEAELLIECVRRSFGKGVPERIDALAARVDRGAFQALAEAHGLVPLAARSIDWLQPAFRENARRALILSAELCRIARLLDAEGIAVLALKGPVLAHLYYSDPACREFFDLDLLVKPEQLQSALRVLARDGYREAGDAHLRAARYFFSSSCHELLLEHEVRRVQVDLHWSPLPPHFPAGISTTEAFARARRVDLNGQSVATLSHEDTLLFLCVHGAKHCWSRLSMVADVCGVIASAAPSPDRAPRGGAVKMLAYGVAAAQNLLSGDSAAAGPEITPGTIGELHFQWRLADGRARMIRYILSLVFIPKESDWVSPRLPHPALFFLYYPWRLLRLAWKWLPARN